MTLRLDFLSPLPPVRSGIADYSVDLLPHLGAHADVRVLRLPDLELDAEVARRFEVAVAAERAGEDGRLPVYQMGNNRYHAAIWELGMERPGVVVLHDFVLHHFLLDRTVGHGAWEEYRAELTRCHGWIGDAVARPVRWGAFGKAGQFELPANRRLLERQRGVVVHGAWAAERLAEEDPRLRVRVVPMGIPLPREVSEEEGRAFRRARGIPERAPLLGSFGFQTPIKRTDVAIRALARPELATSHLLVAGELSPYAEFDVLAARLGVSARVHLLGYLPFAEMQAAIAATDLCLNLRYPSAGETSASLLRILALGRPVVVSDYGEFGELPSEVAIRVPLGEGEAESFASEVARRVRAGRDELVEMGRMARRHVAERHAPARAGAAMAAALAELAGGVPPREAAPHVPPATSMATSRPRGEMRVLGAEDWPRGERRRLVVRLRNLGAGVWLPSREAPGGVILEPRLRVAGDDAWRGREWLELRAPLAPGEAVELELRVRRPLAPALLELIPRVATAGGWRRFGDWRSELAL